MKTNIEKAIKCLEDTFDNATGHYIQNPSEVLVTHENALEAIKIASKTDWYYPSKGELPKIHQLIITDNEIPYKVLSDLRIRCLLDNSIINIEDDNVKAYTYLPKYEDER